MFHVPRLLAPRKEPECITPTARQSDCNEPGQWVQLESADEALGGSTIRLLATDEQGDRVYTVLTRSILNYDMSSGQWAPAGIGLEGDTVQALSVSTESSLSAISSTTLGVFKIRTAVDCGLLSPPGSPSSRRPGYSASRQDAGACVRRPGPVHSTDAGEAWVDSLPVADRMMSDRSPLCRQTRVLSMPQRGIPPR